MLPRKTLIVSSLAWTSRPFFCKNVRYLGTERLVDVITPREAVEKGKKEYEDKYGHKLKEKMKLEGVTDLEALRNKLIPKVKTPPVEASPSRTRDDIVREGSSPVANPGSKVKSREETKGDRSGVKPLSSILNLPLLLLTPHDPPSISKIWTTYHTTHPTLSSSYLSATLPISTYRSMISLAKENPSFVLPLPRQSTKGIEMEKYDMYYLQWLFHSSPIPIPIPILTSHTNIPIDSEDLTLSPITSVLFTPLEEYKHRGEWSQPHLVLTHYTDLSNSHGLVLMRGEISPLLSNSSSTSTLGSESSTKTDDQINWMLSQSQAQLLVLGLQRFYCSEVCPDRETSEAAVERRARREMLRGMREKPREWNWTSLVDMAYGGLV
ncbi:hypothetical protein M231_04541 [Tremella mesenterica]|uniref:ATP synthase mitochondrial F1 complex assembly factor 1 n=1 Tax=Tremella mesenterica TaxID=5217 RepID=A0A4V1M3V3_TREME|nr:hypothetical protein M231_04541 [Tremella mesenterica]